MLSIALSSRNNDSSLQAPPLLAPPLAWTVEQLTWRAVGGPWGARLHAAIPGGAIPGATDITRLWQLAGLLGCGLTVFDERAAAWWGYCAAVELHAAGQVVRVALDGMANQVAVSYHERTPNDWGGPRRQTPWREDAASVARYGPKQRIFDLGPSGADGASAAAYAATLLAQSAAPQAKAGGGPGGDDNAVPYALVEGRGWWEMLDWCFYADARGLEGHQAGGSVAVGVGDRPGAARAAQSFHLASAEGWTADAVWLKLRRNHAADDLRLELCAGDEAAPGAALAYAVLPAAAMGEELGWTCFNLVPQPPLSALPALQPGAAYWLVLSRSGPPDANGFVQFAADEAAGYPRGGLRLWDGASWQPRVPDADMHFQVTGVEETSAQIAHLLGDAVIFSRMRVEAASGINARVYRDGTRRARAEVEDLLRGGTAAGARLLACVSPERVARVYPQPPASQAALALGPGGQLQRLDGRALAPCEWPAGRWARLGSLAQPEGATGVAGTSGAFIEACAWEPQVGFKLTAE